MSLNEICEMGRKLGVINKENESLVHSRIKEFECKVESGKKGNPNKVI